MIYSVSGLGEFFSQYVLRTLDRAAAAHSIGHPGTRMTGLVSSLPRTGLLPLHARKRGLGQRYAESVMGRHDVGSG